MRSIRIELLTTPTCVRCEEFKRFWKGASLQWPNVFVREISVLTEEGQALALKHRVFAAPGIILEDTLIASGNFDPKVFEERLQALSLS